jgi:3-dehydroquinate dehydratase-2
MKILVLNGPNLNLLGVREPDIYGTDTLAAIEDALKSEASALGVELEFRQSNHEGDLIDAIHAAMGEADGVLLNPGGLTHTSVSLADAVKASGLPVVEVHLSNIFAREDFRKRTVTAPCCIGLVAGFGKSAYLLALRGLAGRLSSRRGSR